MNGAKETQTDCCEFERPEAGLCFEEALPGGLVGSGLPAWQSHGGPTRGLPARSLPFTLEVELPEGLKESRRLHLVGVFALYADRDAEAIGTLGASVHLVTGDQVHFRKDLYNGRHYLDATLSGEREWENGDGTSVSHIGTVDSGYGPLTVSMLTIDLPDGIAADRLRFKDLGSPASFLLFDVFAEYAAVQTCPFRSGSSGIPLSDVPAIVRVGDRVSFAKCVDQLTHGMRGAEDLDEARGQALTFLALVTSAALEMGGFRSLHRMQLEAAREFDLAGNSAELCQALQGRIEQVAGHMFRPVASPSGHLVDRAIEHVDKNYASPISDASVSSALGLSTSHFRHLFKEATGQPFHKYVVALRLEKARRLLQEVDMPVAEVATAVGFRGLSHFSRLFTNRFSVCPTRFRRSFHEIS